MGLDSEPIKFNIEAKKIVERVILSIMRQDPIPVKIRKEAPKRQARVEVSPIEPE